MPPEQGTPFDPLDAGQRNERLHTFAHAVKNRMGSMWQAASMLHDLPDGPERAQLLAMAEKSYFAGARELEQLMDDFAVPRGIGTLRKATFDLLPVLERSIASIGFRTLKKAQQVNLRAPGPVMVHGDEHVLGQLFEALLLGPLMSAVGRTRLAPFTATPSSKDLLVMKELIEAGKVVPVIDRSYPLGETAEAIRYLEDGHARGKVVITVAQGSQA